MVSPADSDSATSAAQAVPQVAPRAAEALSGRNSLPVAGLRGEQRGASPAATVSTAVAGGQVVINIYTSSQNAVSTAPSAAEEDFEAEYGLIEDLANFRDQFANAAQDLGQRLVTALQNVVSDVSTLHVATYVSSDMGSVNFDRRSNKFTGEVKLQALTSINLDGDAMVCVPGEEGGIDQALWEIHSETVKQSMAHRAEMLKLVGSAAGELLKGLGHL